MTRRQKRRCTVCATPTRSVTLLCLDHRTADAVPVVHVDGRIVAFAGLTLTTRQAPRLADAIVDAAEQIDHTPKGRP